MVGFSFHQQGDFHGTAEKQQEETQLLAICKESGKEKARRSGKWQAKETAH